MAGSVVCAQCGQRIIGVGNRAYGKVYCNSCYESLMAEAQKNEIAKHELGDYICKLFSILECPPSAFYSIDMAVRDGRKISGIKGTLYYYYEILGHPADKDNIGMLGFIIKTEYENASRYFSKQKEIRKKNAEVNLDLPPVTVKIDVNRETKQKKVMPFKIEDL